jgi:hypothetical protein
MIYILDGGGHHVGPFKNRGNVQCFIKLMAMCGEDWAGNKIVEIAGGDTPGQNPAQMNSCANPWKSPSKLKLVGRSS